MVEIKDKVITAESLKVLHDYDVETFETKADTEARIIPIANGGTNASDGATGLKNLFASGATVLSSYQYGDTLPTAGTVGRIFFKKLSE